MTDIKAEEVAELVRIKKQLLEHLEMLEPKLLKELRFQVSYRVATGMYDGYPYIANLHQLQISQIELGEFLTYKVNEKLKDVNDKLKSI